MTWEQLLHIYEAAIRYHSDYSLPAAYQAEPKEIYAYLTEGLNALVKEKSARKMSQKEFNAKMRKMREKMKHNGPLSNELKQKIISFAKHMKTK